MFVDSIVKPYVNLHYSPQSYLKRTKSMRSSCRLWITSSVLIRVAERLGVPFLPLSHVLFLNDANRNMCSDVAFSSLEGVRLDHFFSTCFMFLLRWIQTRFAIAMDHIDFFSANWRVVVADCRKSIAFDSATHSSHWSDKGRLSLVAMFNRYRSIGFEVG